MILVKLGGSVITNKERPLSPRRAAIGRLADALGRLGEPVIAVHGGGSFGHYWSVKHRMHTRPAEYGARGVAAVKDSMVTLNSIVLRELLAHGQSPYPLPPAAIVRRMRADEGAIRDAARIAEARMLPVTFGDALWAGSRRTFILSGDRIMSMMAAVLKPRLCVFALNADGVYADPATREVIAEMRAGARARVGRVGMDVTGGMARKLVESGRIARGGTDVFVVNGNRPERIVDAVKRRRYRGTLIRGRRNGRGAAGSS